MTNTTQISKSEMTELALQVLSKHGYSSDHAGAIAQMLTTCQMDDCQSHGLYRLFMCAESGASGLIDGTIAPTVETNDTAVVRADAKGGMSLLAVQAALPALVNAAQNHGVAVLAVNRCFHFSALWPEVEALARQGLAALSMVPSHAWVAPAGGTKGTFGTNPLAFAWPRMDDNPLVFDFATSAFARGEIELYRRAGKPLPDGVAIDAHGNPTNDPQAALDGAMLTFGGHKGSALSLMIELMAGPLIDDLTSKESQDFAKGGTTAPYHGQIIIAFDPEHLSGGKRSQNNDRAEALLNSITDQGARLPAQRRYEARARNTDRGFAEVPSALLADLRALLG